MQIAGKCPPEGMLITRQPCLPLQPTQDRDYPQGIQMPDVFPFYKIAIYMLTNSQFHSRGLISLKMLGMI